MRRPTGLPCGRAGDRQRQFGVTICAVTDMNVFSSTPRFVCIGSALLFVGVVGSTPFVYPQEAQDRTSRNEVELLPVQGNISMLAGAGGNITVQVGKDGVFLVDSGAAAMSEKVLEAIRTLSKGQVTYIVNTSDRSDHVGGNETFARTGRPLPINRAAQASVFIIAFSTHSGPDERSQRQAADPGQSLAKRHVFGAAEEPVLQRRGDRDLSSAGDARTATASCCSGAPTSSARAICSIPTQYPVIDVKNGGSLQGVLEGLNRLRQMAIPADHVEGGTMIVPGHGRLCDMADLAIYHQMVTIVRDRLQDMIKRGMTLEQVKAAQADA